MSEPEFTIDGGFFTVSFKRSTGNGIGNDIVKSKGSNEDIVYELIKGNKSNRREKFRTIS